MLSLQINPRLRTLALLVAIMLGALALAASMLMATPKASALNHNADITLTPGSDSATLLVYYDWGANGPKSGTKTQVIKRGQTATCNGDCDGFYIGSGYTGCYALTNICYRGPQAVKARGGGYSKAHWRIETTRN